MLTDSAKHVCKACSSIYKRVGLLSIACLEDILLCIFPPYTKVRRIHQMEYSVWTRILVYQHYKAYHN